MASNWYALRTKSQRETQTAAALTRGGIRSWTPTRTDWRRANRSIKVKSRVTRTMIPGYILAELDEPVNWLRIMSLRLERVRRMGRWEYEIDTEPSPISPRAVFAVVGYGDQPAQVAPASIDRLARMSTTAPPETKHMPAGLEYEPGDVVEFLHGPLMGERVVVEGIAGRMARVHGLHFLGASSIEVSTENIGKFA